jgi:hypothetical protein
MTLIFEKAGAAFLRAFVVGFLFFSVGILNAPNVSAAEALAISAFAASIAAGLKAVQVFVPQFSWGSLIPVPWSAYADSFTRAFVGTFIVAVSSWLVAIDLSTWKSVLLAAVIGAATAGVRALQGFATAGESPSPGTGF